MIKLSRHWKHLMSLVLVLLVISCVNEEIKFADIDGSYAIPLIDTEMNIIDIAENTSQEIKISTNEDNQVTISYLSDVIQQNSSEIFPLIPWFQDIVLIDTMAMVPLPFVVDYTIKRAKFQSTRIRLKFHSQYEEDIQVTFSLPDTYKDGEAFTKSYTIPYDGESPSIFESDLIDLTDWELITDTNEFNYRYDARNAAGDRVELEYVAMFVEVLNFSYVEGFFGEQVFNLIDYIITVGVFNKWLSGGFIFEDPKVRIIVENSFGLPVQSVINEIRFTSINNVPFYLDGENFEDGIAFDYPTLSEVGETKFTEFVYTSANSNVGEIFNEKTKQVTYDVDAIINKGGDKSDIGFLTDSSFYRVQLSLDVPLQLRLNDLKLTDTIDMDLSELDQFSSAEFKFVTQNAFPFNVDLQAYFLDTLENISTPIFEGDGLFLESADLHENGVVTPKEEATTFVALDENQFTNLIKAHQIAMVATFSNSEIAPDESFWILSDYGINLKLGAIVNNE